MNWQTVPLGTLADFRNGINYTKKNLGKGIKVINVRNFQDYSYATFDDLDEVNLIKVIKEEDLLKKNDIIFVRSNGNRQLIGRILFVSDIKEKVVHSAFTIKVRFNSEKIIPRFYAYLFRTSLIRQTLSVHGNGTNISNLNQQILSNLSVPLPALSTQNKIVNIISAYDDLIENNTRRIKILETMAQTLYQEWFVKFPFPGHEQVNMVESELGLIPEGWEVKELGDISEITSSKRIYTKDYVSEGIPFYRQKEIIKLYHDGSINAENLYISNEKFNQIKAKFGVPQENDILITSVGTLGIPYLVKKDDCFYFKDGNLIWFRNNEILNAFYLYQWLDSDNGQDALFQTTIGTSQKAFTIANMKRVKIIFPIKELRNQFVELIIPIYKQRNILQKKNINLRKTRDLLLPKLISGQIDVENLDIDTGELAA